LKNHINLYTKEWKSALSDRRFLLKLLTTPGFFLIYSSITQKFGNYVEMRKGILLNDKLLEIIPSYDFSLSIFILLYSSLTIVILTHLHKPKVILRIIEMHFLVAVVRQICILCIALEPPMGIIVLRDVFLENTVYPRNSPLTKDLFFSGHVASIWLYSLCSENKMIKYYFGLAAILMSFMILSMRVHYSYDVYGAFFFTTIIYFLPNWVKSYMLSKSVVQ